MFAFAFTRLNFYNLKTILRILAGFTLALILLVPQNVSAQYFVAGQDPGGIKWRQIQTDHFQILYPTDYETEGQRVAHIFEKVYNYSGVTLLNHPRKITIILHAKSMKSNGFVAWSPSRIELFPTPSQETYAQEWIEQLATHELRHHVQIDKIETELPAIFKILLGEQAASIVIGAYLPFWFLEGDAVVTETALSPTGRGRVPSFTMELKAQADEKGIYSFDKAYLGSYKDYIPDYYQLGYQMVSNIRNQNGGEVWGKVLHHIAKNPLGFNSLSKGLKLATGKNQDEHYREIMNNLKNTNPFKLNNQEDAILSGRRMVGPSNEYISYRYPHFLNDSSVVALKTSLGHIQALVLIDKNQNERKLFSPGFILEESMSVSNGKIVWIESQPDLRWTHRDKSLLRILNIQSGQLTEKIFADKLFAPEFSPDGKWISVVKLDELNHSSVAVLDAGNYKTTQVFRANENHYYLTPSWSTDGHSIYAIDLGAKGKSIVRINLANREKAQVTDPVFGEVKKPVQWNNYLLYTANQTGKFEGFAIDLNTNMRYLIVTAKYGIKDLQCSGGGNNLIFADYSANGYKMATKVVNRGLWKEIDSHSWFQDTLANKLTAQEKGAIDFSKLDTIRYTSQKYVKFKNLINIHSWSPVYVDPDNSTVNMGFSVISQNKLTTAITQFGYNYSSVNQAGKWVGKFEYSGWYPILRIYGDYGRESSKYYQINKHYSTRNVLIGQDTVAVPYTQKVLNTHFDALIPFNFSRGKMFRMVEPEIQIGYSHYWQDPSTPSMIFRGSYIPVSYRLYLHNIMQQSTRDIQAKWGQIVDLQFRHTPFGDKRLGNIVSAEGTFYFPGLINNQGIRIYTGYQLKKSSNTYFSDLIYYPRGYTSVDNNALTTIRSDYVLPVLSPDWHIWHLYYLKRITMRIFYDYAQISIPIHQTTNTLNKSLSSTGAELVTECHFLRFIAPFKLGVREAYLIESGQFSSEFLLSVNFKGM
jgi:hypothetical protein